jgi:hypothetical protein
MHASKTDRVHCRATWLLLLLLLVVVLLPQVQDGSCGGRADMHLARPLGEVRGGCCSLQQLVWLLAILATACVVVSYPCNSLCGC